MEQAFRFHDPAGHSVAAILSTPSQATDRLAVLCHGFLSNKNSSTNKALTRLLNDQGIATLRFDFFGQGESEGPFEGITVDLALGQVLAALDVARSKGYRRLGLIGSSFGGLVSILAASKRPDVSALGLKCPVADFPEVLRLEFGQAGMDRWRQRNEIPDVTGGTRPVRLPFAFYENCLGYDAYKAAGTITVPVLIVQGDCDDLVPLHQSRRLWEAVAVEKDLKILNGADHGFTKADDFRTMTTVLVEWMINHLGK
ncbi:MAG: alpha/beta hydrolase [Nitrospiraceae bacterium]